MWGLTAGDLRPEAGIGTTLRVLPGSDEVRYAER